MLVFILAWVPYSFFVHRFRWICDDAFISFRYAFNWASGNGLRYNLGDHVPVEGYSNFLWVAVCTIFEYFKADITFWPLLISFICGSILLYLVFATMRYRLGFNLTLAFIATLFLACSPPFVVWSTSGLETIPFALLLFVTFERLILRENSIAPVSAGIFGLALALMRVEGIYWAVLLAAIAIFSRRLAMQKFLREISIYLTMVIVGYAIYWVMRYSYYQLPFANTVYVKVSLSLDTLMRGVNYVAHFFLTILPLFIILPGIEFATRKNRPPLSLEVIVIPLVAIVYSIIVSGDFMPMGRFFVPGIPFYAILFGWLLRDIWHKYPVRRMIVTIFGIMITCVGLLPAWDVHLVPENFRRPFNYRKQDTAQYFSEYKRWVYSKNNLERWIEKGKILKSCTQPNDRMVQAGIGAVGYYSNRFMYDRFGLVTRRVAILENENKRLLLPGHDKVVPFKFFLEDKPEVLWAIDLSLKFVQQEIKAVARNEIAKDYYLDIVDMPVKNAEGEPRYLIIYKRIKEGVDPESAWDRTYKLLDKINGEASLDI